MTRNLSKSLKCKIYVKVTGSRCVLSEDVEEKHYARFEVSTNYIAEEIARADEKFVKVTGA